MTSIADCLSICIFCNASTSKDVRGKEGYLGDTPRPPASRHVGTASANVALIT